MKRWLLVFLLFPGLAWGTKIVADQSGDWSDTLSWIGHTVPTANDTVYITSGVTITIDTGATASAASKTCDIVVIDKGSILRFHPTIATKFHSRFLWAGGCPGISQDSGWTKGGVFQMFHNDTLWVENDDSDEPCSEARQEVYFGSASAGVFIQGKADSPAVLIGILDAGDGPSWWVYSGGDPGTIHIQYAEFHNWGDLDTPLPYGLDWDDDPVDSFFMDNVVFDSSNLSMSGGGDARRITNCSTVAYFGTKYPWQISSNNMSVVSSSFVLDQNNQASGNMEGAINADGSVDFVADSCLFRGIGIETGTPRGPSVAVSMAGATDGQVLRCRIDSFMTPILYGTATRWDIKYCTLTYTGTTVFDHSNWTNASKGNRIAGNYIYGTMGSHIDIFTIYCEAPDDGDSLDLRIINNTAVTFDSATGLAIRSAGSSIWDRDGVSFSNNLLAIEGDAYSVFLEDSTGLILDDWSSNILISHEIESEASIDSTTKASAGTNINDSSFAFRDSIGGDLTLWADSDMLGALLDAADSAWCDSFFTSPNYNVGAYQGPGFTRYNLMIGRNTTLVPGVTVGTGRAE